MWSKGKKRQLPGILSGMLVILILMSGCSGSWEREEAEKGLREEIIALLPEGEAIDEVQIIEREKTRDLVRYQVYCRWDSHDGEAAYEKCYQVTCCRRNGRWVYDTRTGIRLLEERTTGVQ